MTQYSPGLETTESQSKFATPANVGGSVGGFVGASPRGPAHKRVLITSKSQFLRIFGLPTTTYLYDAIKGFFGDENGKGGERCWVTRSVYLSSPSDITTFDAVAAFANFPNSTPTNTLKLGMSWLGSEGNNFKATTTRRDKVVTTTAQATGTGARTSLLLTSTARIRVGDTLYMVDGGGDKLRVIVTAINGNSIVFASSTPSADVASGTSVVRETFDVAFYENSVLVGTPYVDCRMSSLAGRYYVEKMIVNEDDPEAQFIAVDLGVSISNTVDNRPADQTITFSSGADGTSLNDASIVGVRAAKTGLYSLDGSSASMVSVPGQTSTTVVQGIQSYVEYRKFVLGIVEPPLSTSPSGLITWLQVTTSLSGTNLVLLYPWIKVDDPDGSGALVLVPPSGDYQGLCAGAERAANLAQSPAGDTYGRIARARKVEREIDKATYDELYPLGINAIQVNEGVGICVNGDRTLGETGQVQYVNQRRVQNFAMRTFDKDFRWVLFKNNDDSTQKEFRRRGGAFLRTMWKNNLLEGAKASEAFYIVCDASNNTEAIKKAKRFKARIGLHHKDSINFAEFEFEPDERALAAELAG